MKDIWFIAAGGAMGAVCRYGVSVGASRLVGTAFPWGTLVVNVAGCFLLGLLLPIGTAGQWLSSEWQRAIGVGFLGALTTFSTFGLETTVAWQNGYRYVAIGNVAANLALGLLAVTLGLATGQKLVN